MTLPHGFRVGDIIYYKGEEWSGNLKGKYFGIVIDHPRQSKRDIYARWSQIVPSETPPKDILNGGGYVSFLNDHKRVHRWVIDYKADQEADESEDLL